MDTRNDRYKKSVQRIYKLESSIDINGGTPGKINSTDAVNPDKTPPKLTRAFATDSVTLSLVFDEPLDSLKAYYPLITALVMELEHR